MSDETFEIRLPHPPPGFSPPDVLFLKHDVDEPGSGRDSEDIMLRKVPTEVAMRFRAAAGGRAMTHAQYLAALVALHERMRALADTGNDAIAGELDSLGLTTVSV
jgi:hypothetical protein